MPLSGWKLLHKTVLDLLSLAFREVTVYLTFVFCWREVLTAFYSLQPKSVIQDGHEIECVDFGRSLLPIRKLVHWIFSHLVVLKLTFHPSLIGFATSGHFFGVANPRCFGTPQPQGLAVGQTDGKPSMNTGAGPIGWAAHGSTRWEICFMMFWKPVELIPA